VTFKHRRCQGQIACPHGHLRFRPRRAQRVMVAAALLWSSLDTFAANNCVKGVCVEQVWARATPPGAGNAAVYFSIVNMGSAPDTLSSASAAAATQTMLHRTTVNGGVVHMDMVTAVQLPPGTTVNFSPTGYHVMLTGLKMPFTEGATVPITLQFVKAGKIDVLVHVLGVTAIGPTESKPPLGLGVQGGGATHDIHR
jgi:copper(I)-binding protein